MAISIEHSRIDMNVNTVEPPGRETNASKASIVAKRTLQGALLGTVSTVIVSVALIFKASIILLTASFILALAGQGIQIQLSKIINSAQVVFGSFILGGIVLGTLGGLIRGICEVNAFSPPKILQGDWDRLMPLNCLKVTR